MWYTHIREVFMNALNKFKYSPVQFGLTKEQKQAYVDQIWAQGGEGMILKHRDGRYEPIERRPTRGADLWLKCKKTVSNALGGEGVDAWVSGFKPGTPGTANEGMIGALLFSVYLLPSGRVHQIAACSNFTREDRMAWTVHNSDGSISLREDIYDRIAEIEGMDISSSLEGGSAAITHARFKRWREGVDAKPKEQCTFSEALLNDLVL